MKAISKITAFILALAIAILIPVDLRFGKDAYTAEDLYSSAQIASNDDASYSLSQNTTDYLSKLTQICKTYDNDVTDDADEEFALRRLIVSNYTEGTFDSVDMAVDEENNFAVFQYDTVEATKNAYQKMTELGLAVDPDCMVYPDSTQVGELCPKSGKKLGTSSFVNNFEMSKDDVVVAVIDTGVMYDHEAISNRFVNEGYDFSTDGADNAYYDTELEGTAYMHSTAISGIIADSTPDNVKILPYKVIPFGKTSTELSLIISAINDAISKNVDVINLSYSSNYGANSFKTVIKNAMNKGICFCCSAGNTGVEETVIYPANIAGAITVSALNRNDVLASFSSFGDYVDFCAPGSYIYTSVPGENGESAYSEVSGTSFSAPYVAAICADLKSVNKNYSKDQIYQIIKDFAVDYGDEGFDSSYGWGVPNIGNIVYSTSSYSYSIPQGELNIYSGEDYTADTQPWKMINSKILNVNIDSNVDSIGNYEFYSLSSAKFNMAQTYNYIGEYAFYGCKNIDSFSFDIDVSAVGIGAFKNISDDFTIYGYRNTPAESYALTDGINFVSLGCNHNYMMNIVEPTVDNPDGYTEYTCTVCGDYYIGEYIEPVLIDSGACGENLTYSLYDTGKLAIDGTGSMYDYSNTPAPWYDNALQIKFVAIGNDVENIDNFAFYGCSNLTFFKAEGNFAVVNSSLYSADEKQLIAYAGGINSSVYEMPSTVESFDASAFVNASRLNSYVLNSNFTVKSNIVYDLSGNIVMALPSYSDTTLKITSDISICNYAFILENSLKSIRFDCDNVNFGEYSVGYSYDNTMKKSDIILYGNKQSSAQIYAEDNDVTFVPINSGVCGENITWLFDDTKNKLTLEGSGEMNYYSSLELIPWNEFMSAIKTVVIDDEITYISDYAFYGAKSITSLTLPLSINAPVDDTTWYNCTSIKTLKLTYGTGYMDDYGYDENESLLYTYTPWYLSRKTITSFSLDKDVKYIGDYAFRNCLAIKSLTLNDCDYIGEYAFLACSNLKTVTNYCKTTKFGTYSLFAYYYNNEYCYYKSPTLCGYDDSTSKDYVAQNGMVFESLGCGHSRCENETPTIIEPTCCNDGYEEYNCPDCLQNVKQVIPHTSDDGHYVKGTVKNKKGDLLNDLEVYIDDELVAVTDSDGKFIISNVKCGEHKIEFMRHNVVAGSGTAVVEQSNVSANISIWYGDFYQDGYVNAIDFAYGYNNKFDDIYKLDFGKVEAENFVIDEKYDSQATPCFTTLVNSASDGSSYKRVFVAQLVESDDFQIKECGVIYGKNMSDDMLTIENIDKENEYGYVVKRDVFEGDGLNKQIVYGSSSKNGTVSARFYIVYTNGVKDFVYYSNISSYTY